MDQQRSQVIYAPSREHPAGRKTIFLAGSTSQVEGEDWRQSLAASLHSQDVTIYNPYRAEWDSSWREDLAFAPYREQVEWELEKQDQADIVVVYFHPDTQAPVSLLELGLCARQPGKAIVCCPKGYCKRGNVEIVCERYDVRLVESFVDLRTAVMERLVNDRDR